MPQHRTKPKQRLRDLKVREISLVDDGDNPLARVVLFKRRTERNKPGMPGYDPSKARHPSDEDRRRRRMRPRRGRGALDGDNKVAKATARTSADGVGPHTHELMFPDGPITAGRLITEEAEGHTHQVVLPDLEPGQSADIQTSSNDGHTHSIRVTATESTANPGAQRILRQRGDDEKPRRRGRRRRGPRTEAKPGFVPTGRQLLQERRNPLRKQEEQDFRTQGGTRFRSNAWAFSSGNPSEWKLRLFDTQADADANRPSIQLTAGAAQALGPSGFRGSRVQLPSGARTRTIARVRGAWLRARRQADQDVSREDLPTVLKISWLGKFADTIREWSGKEPDDDLEKRLFDDVRSERMTEQVADALLSRVGDLATSVREIVFSPPDGSEEEERDFDVEGAISETLKQFASAMDGELAGIFAGQITKQLDQGDDEGAPSDEEIEEMLKDLFTQPTGTAPGATRKEGDSGMDLTKLSKKDREEVEAALTKAGTVEDLNTQLVTATAKVAELEKDSEEDPDPLESLPEDVRKVVDPLLKSAQDEATKATSENAVLKGRIDKIEAATAREEFAKGVGDLIGLPQKREDIVESLWTMTDVEARGTMQKNLEAAAAAARRGNLFGEIGSGMGGDGDGSAYSKIEAAATEIRKANPKVTEAQARAQAMNDNPELYDAYLEEQPSARLN